VFRRWRAQISVQRDVALIEDFHGFCLILQANNEVVRRILGSHSGDYGEFCHVEYNAM
jgi:hypothetical protein